MDFLAANHVLIVGLINKAHRAVICDSTAFLLICCQSWRICLMQRQNSLFSVSGLKEEKLIKKQTYTKTETRKLYYRVF